jgi:hypothetical protein
MSDDATDARIYVLPQLERWDSRLFAALARVGRPIEPYRLLVTASRSWSRLPVIRAALDHVGAFVDPCWGHLEDRETCRHLIVVHGAAWGGDTMAGICCRRRGWTEEPHPVSRQMWDQQGRSAGFQRDRAMVGLGAHLCLAFIRRGSSGASTTAGLAVSAGIETVAITDLEVADSAG